MSRPRGFSLLFTVLCLLILVVAIPAHATFPGNNGRIAFSQGYLGPGGDLSSHSQVFTITPRGHGLTKLTHVARDHAAGSPDWSRDGRRIAYQSNQSGSFEIWVMNANGSGKTRLTHESGFEDFQPSWSPNGKKILFSHCGEPFGFGFIAYCDIEVINADGTGAKTLLSSGHWMNVRPEYSPNGKRIVFSSDRGGLQSAVWVMKADGSSPKRLTAPRVQGSWPDWSPSGRRILFRGVRHGAGNVFTVRPNGRGLRIVTRFSLALDGDLPSYSPNGKRIVFLCFGCDRRRGFPSTGFWTMRADGSRLDRVVTGKPNTFLTDWGPRR
jgi:TolB protein